MQRFFFSQREIQQILANAEERQRTWYGLAAETGLRAGELCGLTVDDLDLERRLLQVQRSAWRGKIGDPKTNDSIRVVELPPQAPLSNGSKFLPLAVHYVTELPARRTVDSCPAHILGRVLPVCNGLDCESHRQR